MHNALQLVRRSLVIAAATHDSTLNQLAEIVDREFCAAPGLRLRNRVIDVVVTNFIDHEGRRHERVRAPVEVVFLAEAESRGSVDVQDGRGIIHLSYAKATKDVVTVGPHSYVPTSSLYCTLHKSTLVHEIYHVLDILTGVPRFQKHIEHVRIHGETPEQYRLRYHYSVAESRAHTAQLLYVISERLAAKLDRISVLTGKLKAEDAVELEKILKAPAAEMLQVLIDIKIVPKKLLAWLANIQLPQAPPEIYSNLLRQLARLQSLYRSKYEHARYSGA